MASCSRQIDYTEGVIDVSVLKIGMRRVSGVSLFLKSVFLTGMVIVLVFALFDSADAASKPSDAKAVYAVNSLASSLYGKISSGGDNFCFSPYSISSAFAMLYAGAAGETAAEMKTVFNYGEGIHASNRVLMKRLNSTPAETGELSVANSIWPLKKYRFLKSYTSLLKRDYKTEVTPLDYKLSPEPSRKTINKWVEDKTRERIKDILPETSITPDTRLVLVNAIYFKSKWSSAFDERMTQEADFTTLSGDTVKVKMMEKTASFAYAEIVGAQALELQYRGGLYSMLILLPEKNAGLSMLERRINEKFIKDLSARLTNHKVNVFLPKFKVESSFDIGKTIGELGLKRAFTAKADFSKMNGKRDLFVSSAVHKAFIEVDEHGTEAAAATAVTVMRTTAMPHETEKVILFRADHPFVFVIRDNASGAILFMGRVTKP